MIALGPLLPVFVLFPMRNWICTGVSAMLSLVHFNVSDRCVNVLLVRRKVFLDLLCFECCFLFFS